MIDVREKVGEAVAQVKDSVKSMASTPPTEDRVTKSIERYTASIPSSAFLAVAVGAMGASLALQILGRGKWGNFVAQWVPTWLIIGMYNKLVKQKGHDRYDPADGNMGTGP